MNIKWIFLARKKILELRVKIKSCTKIFWKLKSKTSKEDANFQGHFVNWIFSTLCWHFDFTNFSNISKEYVDFTCFYSFFQGKKAEGGDIFTSKKEEYKPSEQRKTDQANVDKQVLEAVKKHPEGAALKAYFKSIFSLSKGQFPHTMTF